MSATLQPNVRVGLLAVAWGSTFLWITRALDAGLTSTEITTGRCLIAVACLVAYAWWRQGPVPRGFALWRDLTIAALFCNTLPFLLFSLGQQSVSSGAAGILNATTPLWSLLLGLTLGHDRHRPPWHYVGLFVGFGGVVMLISATASRQAAFEGALLIAGAAASYAVAFTWMGRRLSGTGLPTSSLAAAQMTAATVLSLAPLTMLNPRIPTTVPLAGLAQLLPLGIICTALSFYLIFATITLDGATSAAAVGYLVPVVALALGAMFADETVTVTALVAMVIILTGVALTRKKPTDSQPRTPAPDLEDSLHGNST